MRRTLRIRWNGWAGLFLLAILTEADPVWSQVIPGFDERLTPVRANPARPTRLVGQAVQNPLAPCLDPQQLPGLSDYNGPLKKTVGIFARALERTSIHPPQYKSGLTLCSLTLAGKFSLFIDDATDPAAFIIPASRDRCRL